MTFKSQIDCGQHVVRSNTGGFVTCYFTGECAGENEILVEASLQSFLLHFAERYHLPLAPHQ